MLLAYTTPVYKLVNTSAEPWNLPSGNQVAAGAAVSVLYSVRKLCLAPFDFANLFNIGAAVALGTTLQALDASTALKHLMEMQNTFSGLTGIDQRIGGVLNIQVSPMLIGAIRAEMFGFDGLPILQKLGGIVPAIQSGAFKESAQMVQALTRDEVFTDERVTRWADMIRSADSIVYQ